MIKLWFFVQLRGVLMKGFFLKQYIKYYKFRNNCASAINA